MISATSYNAPSLTPQERQLSWDEENRLRSICDNGYISSYFYDAGGARTVKLHGSGEGIHVNSAFSGGYTNNVDYTLYVDAYMVLEKGGQYTKHIYIGDQRIVSKLGDVGSFGVDPRREQYAGEDVAGVEVPDYKTKYEALQNVIKDNYQLFEVDYYGIDNDNYVDGAGFCCEPKAQAKNARSLPTENVDYEKLQYYYHSDHLGSASYITNLDGEVIQHIEYVPFGEVFLEERNNTWNTPFLFNGKELDEETGLYYYGARYYNPRVSLWYGVDPLAEKYPNISSFAYCANNPVMLVDPDGRDIWELDKNGKEIKRTENKKTDQLVIVDKDGNRIESNEYEYGTIKQNKDIKHKDKGGQDLTLFAVSGDENAKEIFEFLGDNYTKASDKPLEWTHAKIGTEESGRNIIGTTHLKTRTSVGHYLREQGYTLREVNHNHPSGYNTPSEGDIDGANRYQNDFPNIKLNIYTATSSRNKPYTKSTTPYGYKDANGNTVLEWTPKY